VVFFGNYGDRAGRRKALIATLMLMLERTAKPEEREIVERPEAVEPALR
jgi:hypothetical protein